MNRAVDAIQRRLGKAGEHLAVLDQAIEGFIKPKPYTPAVQFDAHRCRVVLRAVDVKPMPGELGILIGECVYQLRAALDNLAFALAERNVGSPLQGRLAKATAFPICNSGPRFREIGPPKLAGLDRRAAAVIESLQPYHRRKKPAALALRQLEELRNVDQHRLLHPVALARDVSKLVVSVGPRDALEPTGNYWLSHRPLKEDAVLASFEMLASPSAPPAEDIQVYVEDNAAIDVVFEGRSPARSVQGKSVVATLSEITAYVRWEVVPELLPFLA